MCETVICLGSLFDGGDGCMGGEGRGGEAVELVWVKEAGEGEDEVTVEGGCYCYLEYA